MPQIEPMSYRSMRYSKVNIIEVVVISVAVMYDTFGVFYKELSANELSRFCMSYWCGKIELVDY